MTRRWRTRVAALAVVVVGAGLVLSGRTGGPAATVAPQEIAASMPTPRPPQPYLRVAPPRTASEPVDIAKVEAALARLDEVGSRISQDQLDQEQKDMLAAKARFEAIAVEEPKVREIVDPSGLRVLEMTHASGEVRYELAPDPEPVALEPAP